MVKFRRNDSSCRNVIGKLNEICSASPDMIVKKSKLLERLRVSGYEGRKNRNPKRVDGTCEWFTHHPLFQDWQGKKSSGLLWVTADPGCGKSVLARYLVDDVLMSTNTRTTCYFFFKDDFDDQRRLESALSCILHQLFLQRPALLSDMILDEFEKGGEELLASFHSLWTILIGVTSSQGSGETVCVLDALDECEERGRSQLAAAFSELYNIEDEHIHSTVSRNESAICQDSTAISDPGEPPTHYHSLERGKSAEVEKISREIDVVIEARIRSTGLTLRDEEKQILREELVAFENRT